MIMADRFPKDKPFVSVKCYHLHKIQDVHYETEYHGGGKMLNSYAL